MGYVPNHGQSFPFLIAKYLETSIAYRKFIDAGDMPVFLNVNDRHQGMLYLTGQQLFGIFRDYRDCFNNGYLAKDQYISYLQQFKAFLAEKDLFTVDALHYDEIKTEVNKFLIAA